MALPQNAVIMAYPENGYFTRADGFCRFLCHSGGSGSMNAILPYRSGRVRSFATRIGRKRVKARSTV